MDWRRRNTKRILDVGGDTTGRSVAVTPDDRSITCTGTATEGDDWLMHLD